MSNGQMTQGAEGAREAPEKPRVLVVDDQRLNLNILHGLLKDDYQVMVAMSGEQCLKAAASGRPDLILLDINMPGMDGYEVCQRLKQDTATKHIPIIFITAMSESQDETRGLELGAADYITKPFHAAVVQARVNTQIRLKQHSDLLESYAFRDGLTGLANRRAFDNRGTAEWSRCRRLATPLSALMIDVDHFKLYNDSYGHGQGDECLRSVAHALTSKVHRTSDMLARYGGEEFVALLPDTDHSAALGMGERLREAVEQLKMEHRASKVTDYVTISVGVATLVPSAEGGLASLLEQADGMLYACKSAGRNCVRGVQAPVPTSLS
jgi:diguanylate cyclase (GGDEF)-like protein